MTIPLVDPIPAQYLIKVTSDRWLGCSAVLGVAVQNLILPESHPPHTGRFLRILLSEFISGVVL